MCLGIPGRIVEITSADFGFARVDVGGVKREVNIACVMETDEPAESLVGEWVLVHVGFAMSRIDPDEAEKTLQLLAELAEFRDEMDAIEASVPA